MSRATRGRARPESALPEALQELLDERLDAPARAELEEHLRSCERCRRELELLRFARDGARASARGEALPDAVRDGALAALDLEDARAARAWPRRGVALAVGLAALLLLALGLGRWAEAMELPLAVARDFGAYRSGALTLDHVSPNTASIQDFFAGRGLGFETRVFDLAMMGYSTVGGTVLTRGGARSALFVYAREDGRPVICQMFPGRVETLPAGAERRTHDGIDFFAYEREGVTVAFWQEGGVVCVLASDIPREELVQLALAKAMKAVTVDELAEG